MIITQLVAMAPFKIKGGGGVGVVEIKMGIFLHKPSFFFIVQYVYLILLNRTSCRKPYFMRNWQLEVGEVIMYDKG